MNSKMSNLLSCILCCKIQCYTVFYGKHPYGYLFILQTFDLDTTNPLELACQLVIHSPWNHVAEIQFSRYRRFCTLYKQPEHFGGRLYCFNLFIMISKE